MDSVGMMKEKEKLVEGMRGWTESDARPSYFDPAFIISVYDYYEKHGTISDRQYNALENIRDKFNIDLDAYID